MIKKKKVNKRVWNAVLGCNLKNDRRISVCFQGKHFNITVVQFYAPTTDTEEAEVHWFCKPKRSGSNTKKRCSFHHRGLECKSQEILGITDKFDLGVQNEAGQRLTVLSREHVGHNKHPFPTTQEMTPHPDVTRWSILKSDWLCPLQPKMKKLYTVIKNKTRSRLWLRSWAPYCKIQTEIEKSRENH